MSVGAQADKATIDAALTDLANTIRNWATKVDRLDTQVNGLGAGLAYLEGIGYSSAPNPANPGNQSDAQWALQVIGYMNTVKGVYSGTVQQGGTGGTGASDFAFHQALAAVWGGQLG